jgi:hypothetical protein
MIYNAYILYIYISIYITALNKTDCAYGTQLGAGVTAGHS